MRALPMVVCLSLGIVAGSAAEQERVASEGAGYPGLPGTGSGAAGGTVLLPGPGGSFQECAGAVFPGALVPVDLYVLMDRSQSMIILDALGQSRTAISDFLRLPDLETVSVGLGFFPLPSRSQAGEDSCAIDDYAVPEVPIAPAYDVASELIDVMNATEADGSTPMQPAVRGAMGYLQSWATAHPGHITALVLATDGTPSTCEPNSVRSVASVVAEGLEASPSIPTYVVGFGLGPDLDAISEAGGTEVFDVTLSDVETELMTALDDIRRIGDCRYQIPEPPPGEALDHWKVNVQNLSPGLGSELLPQSAGAAGCGAARAWYYDDPVDPNQIVLCPQSCQAVKADSSDVQIVLGCETVII